MRAEYKRDMNHNYLILHQEGPIDTSSYQVRMLVGSGIPSVLTCHVQGVDGECLIYYDITSKQPLSALFEEKKLTSADLRLIFGGFIQVMEEMSEYLLNPGHLVLRPEYIYVDVEENKVFFCYLPGFEMDMRSQFQALTEYILPKLDHEDQQAVMLGYGVYRRAIEDSFHLEHIKEELYRERENDEATPEKKDGEPLDMMSSPEAARISQPAAETFIDWTEEGFRMHEGDRETEGEKRYIPWQKIICCLLGALGCMGILGAKLLGYLPDVPLEAVLGVILALMGSGMLVYLINRRKRLSRASTDVQTGGGGRFEAKSFRGDHSEKRLHWPAEIRGQSRGAERTARAEKPKKEEQTEGAAQEGGAEETGEGQLKEKMGVADKGIPMSGLHPNSREKEYFGETVVLSAGGVAGPSTLVSREPGELATIYLKGDLMVIGKLENAADAVIRLPTVSRIHAKIRKREGEYYLTDLNSRNGTAVNGQMLRPDEEYCLQDQDEVDFAQARYIFIKAH